MSAYEEASSAQEEAQEEAMSVQEAPSASAASSLAASPSSVADSAELRANSDPTAGRNPALQSKWAVAAVIACALVAVFWPRGDGVRKAPPGMLVDVAGRPIPLATRTAPVTLIHFWSTWCPPCLDEVPAILRLARDLRNEHAFALVMIAVADDAEKVKTFLGAEIGNSLFDHDWKVTRSYGTDKLPETYLVVGQDITEKFVGATNWDDPKIRDRIQAALAASRQPG
jgi:thiol-disulfide isomerase/thioredoxin